MIERNATSYLFPCYILIFRNYLLQLHEAIAREESHEYKDGIIIQEFRRGFLLEDRLLRPAMVKVSSGPGRKTGSNAPASSGTTAAAAGIDER